MKNIFIGLIAVWGLFLVSCETREPMVEVIERGLEVSKRQAVFLAKEVENQEGRLRPRKADRKRLENPCFRRWPDASVYGYYCTSDFCKRSRLDYS